jgi:hypothetical protein
MTDPNLNDFKGRVARIQEARQNGYGFEATGTLGRSYYHRSAAQRRSVIGPVVFMVLCVFLLPYKFKKRCNFLSNATSTTELYTMTTVYYVESV